MTESTSREELADTLRQLVDEAESEHNPDDGCDHPGLDHGCLWCHAKVQVFHLKDEGVL